MRGYVRISVIGLLAIIIVAFVVTPDAISWRGYHHHHFRYGRHHYHHGHGGYFSLSFPIYGGYYAPGYYPYCYPESVLVYKELPQENALLRLDIQPPEAEVYLDGKYLGRAHSLLDKSIPVRAGIHQVQLTIDGYSRYYRLNPTPGSTVYFTKNMLAE